MRLLDISRSVVLAMPRKACYFRGAIPSTDRYQDDSKAPKYEEAIAKLNSLQSNAETIRQSILNRRHQTTFGDTAKYLIRSGMSLEKLDKLSVIHVSGTKGKGSTCALTESILRAYGIRTGFFSSPHLVAVTERIRINGEAISQKKFTNAFWKVFNRLHEQKESEKDMPAYFKFLTILCVHIFFEEKVDVAILEVGIGGEFDCTNVVRNTPIAGITSLGLEHTNILGDTLEDIAWQKAGIIKPSSKVFTNVTQSACLKVIEERTVEKNARHFPVPDISMYHWPKNIDPSNFTKMVQLNGSLAIQLAYSWLRHMKTVRPFIGQIGADEVSLAISNQVLKGIEDCVWAGRFQLMELQNFRIHFDGAHTIESMNVCKDWFETVSKESSNPKVLIFNATGDRDSKALLKILHSRIDFQFACFVPNIPFTSREVGDIHSVYNSADQIQKAQTHERNWKQLSLSLNSNRSSESRLFETILEAFMSIRERYQDKKVDILVTGSLHLLGATIVALDEFKKDLL